MLHWASTNQTDNLVAMLMVLVKRVMLRCMYKSMYNLPHFGLVLMIPQSKQCVSCSQETYCMTCVCTVYTNLLSKSFSGFIMCMLWCLLYLLILNRTQIKNICFICLLVEARSWYHVAEMLVIKDILLGVVGSDEVLDCTRGGKRINSSWFTKCNNSSSAALSWTLNTLPALQILVQSQRWCW